MIETCNIHRSVTEADLLYEYYVGHSLLSCIYLIQKKKFLKLDLFQ
jgi:hypothetical protein